jgi:hypothetical protein
VLGVVGGTEEGERGDERAGADAGDELELRLILGRQHGPARPATCEAGGIRQPWTAASRHGLPPEV